MAVGTQKDAFRRFHARSGQRSSDPVERKRELLGRRVTVVEVERSLAAVIAAQHARAPGLLHEDLLHLPAPSDNPFPTTGEASEMISLAVADKYDLAMRPTGAYGLFRCPGQIGDELIFHDTNISSCGEGIGACV